MTELVGILPNGAGYVPLPNSQFFWNDTFNGGAVGTGGVLFPPTTLSEIPIDPSSGTGGATITSINGVQQTPSTVSCTATPNTLWPPNGKPVSVMVLGNIVQGTSPVASGGTYAVIDSYGQDEPNGSFTLGGSGTYSFAVPLIAARNGNDQNGRQYIINVGVTDGIGNVGTCSAVVTVPHDQGN